MNLLQFEKEITKAIIEVPKHLRDKIDNLAFVVETQVRPASLKERGIKFQGTLLGLYQGVPLPRRGPRYGSVLPDKITIFKNSIENLAGPKNENISKLIREVVHHEIGHYFGMSEKKVREWERKRRSFKGVGDKKREA